jgi:O-antigen/teichoic acid export membrane protein
MFCFLYAASAQVALFLLAVFLPLGGELLDFVFTAKYESAYWPIVAFLVFLLIYSMPIGLVVKALMKPKYLLYSKAAVIFNVASAIPLVMHFGAMGMAISTGLSQVLKTVILLALVRRKMTLPLPWLSLGKAAVNASIAAMVTWLVPESWPLVSKLAICVLTYLVASKLITVFDNQQSRLLISLMPDRLQPPLRWYLAPERGGNSL